MNLSENVKREIIIRRMTIRELAKETGISSTNISDIVNGKITNPRIETVIKLAKTFNMTIDKLVGREW